MPSDLDNVDETAASADQLDPLKQLVIDQVHELWRAERRPFMLSNLAPALKAHGIEYRSIIGEIKLKDFVETEMKDRVKIVQHPAQRAKIGLIPTSEYYTFSEVGTRTTNTPTHSTGSLLTSKRVRDPRFVVLNFLELLSRLPPEDASQVTIPVQVLAKLTALE